MYVQRRATGPRGRWVELLGYDRARWSGDELRRRRIAVCMTTTELGADAGVSSRSIEAYEAGTTVPVPETALVLANLFGVRLQAFFPSAPVRTIATPQIGEAVA